VVGDDKTGRETPDLVRRIAKMPDEAVDAQPAGERIAFSEALDRVLAPARAAEDSEMLLASIRSAAPDADLTSARAALAAAVDARTRRILAEIADGLRVEASTDLEGRPSYATGSWLDSAEWVDRALQRH
jgi:hypothetical protein